MWGTPETLLARTAKVARALLPGVASDHDPWTSRAPALGEADPNGHSEANPNGHSEANPNGHSEANSDGYSKPCSCAVIGS
ncbi:hypothetical protein NtRootA1_33110 [Arthrobacter sp. NtRootA1]|nr:hypothetical protein NtRootA1_33110 [Arthrobacter sp. NtRootA1]